MLAPGPADGAIQFVDARDLGAFMLRLAERATGGIYNVVHASGTVTRAGLLAMAAREARADTSVTWADPDWLVDQMGDERYQAFPMWDEVDDPWAHRFDSSKAMGAGLRNRSVDVTVRDTLSWDRSLGPGTDRECGLSLEREADLLAQWRQVPTAS